MKKIMLRFFDVRKNELPITLLMLLYIYLIMTTYYFLKPVRDTLFLAEIGWRQLPYVFIIIALFAVPINALYARAGRTLRMNRLINNTTLVLIATLFLLRWIIATEAGWAYYVFYIWVSIFAVLATSQFWLFANAVYSPTQAKRLFVLLNLGAILGAWTGGEVTGLLSSAVNIMPENLLFICMALLCLCMVIVNAIWSIRRKEIEDAPAKIRKMEGLQKESFSLVVKSLRGSRHLLLIVGIIAMTVATGTFVDTQFKGVTEVYHAKLTPPGSVTIERIEGESAGDYQRRLAEARAHADERVDEAEKKAMAGFLGKFYGRLSLVSLILQIFFTYRFLRSFGVGGIIAFLPFGLLLGSAAMLVYPGLLAGILLRGPDVAFKHSLDKTGRELLFLPVPLAVKKRVKIFIDVTVDRWFRGLAGLVLAVCLYAGFEPVHLSPIVILMVLVWLTFVFMARKEYVNAFRKALEKRTINLDELSVNIGDGAAVQHLADALKSENERQIIYALDLMKSAKSIELVSMIRPLLYSTSAEVRLKSIQVLIEQGEKECVADVEKMIADPDHEVSIAALTYLYETSSDKYETCITYLEHDKPTVQAAAAVCVAQSGTEEEKAILDDRKLSSLLSVEEPDGEKCRLLAATALGALNRPEFNKHLADLTNDPSPEVARHALEACGRARAREFVPVLLHKLAEKDFRENARRALAAYGNRVLGTLTDSMNDRSTGNVVRQNILLIMGNIPTQESVNLLTESLVSSECPLRYNIIKALNKIRSRNPDLTFDEKRILGVIEKQIREYYEALNVLDATTKLAESPRVSLLNKAVAERLGQNLEELFRLLGLKYPSKDIFNAYLGIKGGKKAVWSSAVEFLDNVLSTNLKDTILPIVDPEAPEKPLQAGRRLFAMKSLSSDAALISLIEGGDPWLKACAIFAVSKSSNDTIHALIEKASGDQDELVRETASLVMSRGRA